MQRLPDGFFTTPTAKMCLLNLHLRPLYKYKMKTKATIAD
ncbi:hypothetical protein TcasGA2_TC034428 [Tribolium castaneum]|uniref:Uncharacterized protein n=1 Tax=Tribolium castaneum TaxID=7070 RepID=A0A139WBW3_TRICA|nr:hypothetical protein TcasGA2_TC034428 [Tribolium castaneum]